VDGPQAFTAALATGRFDAVLIDERVGWALGGAVSSRLRADDPDCPLLLVTGKPHDGEDGTTEVPSEVERASGHPIAVAHVPEAIDRALEHGELARRRRDDDTRRRLLLPQSQDAVLLMDPETTRAVEFNDAVCCLLGYTRAEFAALRASDYEACEPEQTLRVRAQALVDGRAVQFVSRHRSASGLCLDVDVTLQRVAFGGRRLLHAIVRDLSDLKRAEGDAEKARRFAERLLNSTPDVVCIYDILEHRLTYVNQRVEVISGYSAEEVVALGARVLEQCVHAEDVERFKRDMKPRLTGVTDDETLEFDCRLRHKDGGWRWVQSSGRVFARSAGGVAQQIVATVRDVTAERHAREALQLRTTAVTAVANGIVITDREGTILWVNPAVQGMTGYAPEEIIGRNPRLLSSGRQSDAFYRDLWQTVLAGRVWRGGLENRRKDGTLYTEQMTITPVAIGGEAITHFVAIKADVTREKEYEARLRQAQKMEAVGQLAGGVAHDFNNLLTAILGYSDLLLECTPEGDARRADILEVRDAGDRAAALTRQLLAFSRRQLLDPRIADLNAVVGGLEKMIRRVIRENIRIDFDLARPPVIVEIDVGQLEQVVINLVVNASDAMPDGGTLRLTTGEEVVDRQFVSAHHGAQPGRFSCLRVSDTGTGMIPEVQARIFEPFFTTKAQGKGTGLGLSMAYGFVKQSGGFIWADSTPGAGTSFTIHLPLARGAAPQTRARCAETVALASAGHMVLVVEDDPMVRQLAERVLIEHGYRVCSAATPSAAVGACMAAAGAIDLVLTDVVMPEKSGPELFRDLRMLCGVTRVIYMSGYTDPSTRRFLEDVTPEQFLAKPFGPAALLEKVRGVLRPDERRSGE
jgi:PAS domain S-box-containing protein